MEESLATWTRPNGTCSTGGGCGKEPRCKRRTTKLVRLAAQRSYAEDQARYEELAGQERKGLASRRKDLEVTKAELEAGIEGREEWLGEHPEVELRLEAADQS